MRGSRAHPQTSTRIITRKNILHAGYKHKYISLIIIMYSAALVFINLITQRAVARAQISSPQPLLSSILKIVPIYTPTLSIIYTLPSLYSKPSPPLYFTPTLPYMLYTFPALFTPFPLSMLYTFPSLSILDTLSSRYTRHPPLPPSSTTSSF